MRSKIVLGGFLVFALFGAACDKYKPTSPTQNVNPQASGSNSEIYPSVTTTTPPTSGIGSGLGVISTPKPVNQFDENSPTEPGVYKTASPFIVGKSSQGFNGGNSSIESPEPTVVVPGKISGQVLGYDPNTRGYKVLSNSSVYVGGTTINTDASGRYTTAEVISDFVDISAASSGYYTSTVTKMTPGENRDIHLQPVDSTQIFNSNTITSEIISMAGAEPEAYDITASSTPEPVNSSSPFPTKEYASELSYGDNNNSRFISTLIDPKKGRIRVEVNPISNQSTAKGQMLIYEVERDSSGRPTNPTQMRKFVYKKDITFRVGDTKFPGLDDDSNTTTDIADDELSAYLLKNFININVKFHDTYGFSNFTCNAYVIFPTGEKVLVSKYTGSSPRDLSFRLPKIEGINNLSYGIEAHAGSATLGSDVVVRDLHQGDSVEAYLLKPPSQLNPNYETGSGANPTFSWNGNEEAKAYQAEVQNTDSNVMSAWEGFTTSTSIAYPSGVKGLNNGSQYRLHVVAMDFSYGGLSVLANKAEDLHLRAVRNKDSELPFTIKLASQSSSKLPKGYRISYNTVLFRAK